MSSTDQVAKSNYKHFNSSKFGTDGGSGPGLILENISRNPFGVVRKSDHPEP